MRPSSDIRDVLDHRPTSEPGVTELKVRYFDGAEEWRRAAVDIEVEHHAGDGHLISTNAGVLA